MVLDATPLPVSSPGFMFSPDTPEDSVAQGFQFSAGSGSSVRRHLNFGAANGVSDVGMSPELPVENPMGVGCTVEDDVGEGGGGVAPADGPPSPLGDHPSGNRTPEPAVYLCIWWKRRWLMHGEGGSDHPNMKIF